MPLPDGGRASGLLAFTLLLSMNARAELPQQVEIEWDSPSSCPRPRSLEADVSRLLGPQPQIEPLEFEVSVDELSDGRYRLALEVEGKKHYAHRRVKLATCADVREAAALLIATAIDPQAALRTPAPDDDDEEDERESPRAPREVAPWSLVIRGLIDEGSVPGWSGGASLGALWSVERLRFWAEARHLLARRAKHELTSVEVDLFAGGLGGSFIWVLGPCSLGPAVELEMGYQRGRGQADDRSVEARNSGRIWASAHFGALATYDPYERFGIQLGMYAGTPLRPPPFAIRNPGGEDDVLFRSDLPTVRLALGVRVSLGSP